MLCPVIVSLHYGNLFVMPMLYFVMSFFCVVMWTYPSIISVTATLVVVFPGTNRKKLGP